MKVAIIGAGSSYTPELIEGFIRRKDILTLNELSLMDIDETKLTIVGEFVKRVAVHNGLECTINLTTSLEEAIEESDYILTQIRVGQLPARINDEKIPLKYNLIGQETTGIGGFMCALRTIPQIEIITKTIEKLAPNATLINFANPSGIITQYISSHTNVRSIGLCNIPITMLENIIKRFHCEKENVRLNYIGLNHLSWITEVYHGEEKILTNLFEQGYNGVTMKNMKKLDFDTQLLKSIKAIPCSYLAYYYYRNKKLELLQNEEKTRGEVCQGIEKELNAYYKDSNNHVIPELLSKRGGHLYSEAAVSLIESIETNNMGYHIINVKNEGTLDFLKEDDIIETSCLVGSDQIKILKVDPPHESIKGLIQTIKTFERLTIESALEGDRDKALEALLIHPLVGDYSAAHDALDEMLTVNRQYLKRFFS